MVTWIGGFTSNSYASRMIPPHPPNKLYMDDSSNYVSRMIPSDPLKKKPEMADSSNYVSRMIPPPPPDKP